MAGARHASACATILLDDLVPHPLEALWCVLKPKDPSAKYKKIVACSFYSPPTMGKHSKMADHIVSTLHLLCTKYPDCAIIMGADKNDMDISPLFTCGLKLRQIVDKPTRHSDLRDDICGQNYFLAIND